MSYKSSYLTLEKFVILNILKKHSSITRYQIMKYSSKLQIHIRQATLYSIVNIFLKNGLVTREKKKRAFKTTSRGVWTRRTKEVFLYSLTSEGYKELHEMEFKIRIMLELRISGEEI